MQMHLGGTRQGEERTAFCAAGESGRYFAFGIITPSEFA